MSFQDHLRTCSDCQKRQRPTVRIKAASSYRRERKLSELAAVIRGEYSTISFPSIKKTKTKGASYTGNLPIKLIPLERQFKLKELGRLIRG